MFLHHLHHRVATKDPRAEHSSEDRFVVASLFAPALRSGARVSGKAAAPTRTSGTNRRASIAAARSGAFAMKRPTHVYVTSTRPYPDDFPERDYPVHEKVLTVSPQGKVSLGKRTTVFRLGEALAGEQVGLREVEDGRRLTSFMDLDLGHYDERTREFQLLL